MATRAKIRIAGFKVAEVYKHFDGYPSATLDWLKDFNKEFTDRRGNDPEYKFAQLLRSSAKDAEDYDLNDSRFTGWGVVKYDVGMGEEYIYTLETDGTVTYKEV